MERGSEDRWRTTSSFIRLPSLNLPSCVFQDTEKQQQAAHQKKEQKKNFKTFLIHTQQQQQGEGQQRCVRIYVQG